MLTVMIGDPVGCRALMITLACTIIEAHHDSMVYFELLASRP
jgi:hypothetical protein